MSHFIEWQRDRRRVVVPILILRPTPSTDLAAFEGAALLDTGSTTTGITPKVADALRLIPKGKRPIGSVQGEGQAERYLCRIGLALPDAPQSFPFIFDDIEAFELKPSFQLHALIGMDILSQCDFAEPHRCLFLGIRLTERNGTARFTTHSKGKRQFPAQIPGALT